MTTPHVSSTTRAVRPRGLRAAPLAADGLAVVVFVLLGRRSHGEDWSPGGVAGTAWPFLIGCLLGWVAVVGLQRAGRIGPGRSIGAGALVLAGTVAAGMAVRRLAAGEGTPVSFVLVATTVLAALLLGWRGVVRARRGPA